MHTVRWSLPGIVLPCGKTLLWISKAAEIPGSVPTMFVFFGSLALTNYLLCLLEIGGTFLTTMEVLCVMEPFEEVREGAFLEQTRLTLHHNLQTELNCWLPMGEGTVTCVICIRPSLLVIRRLMGIKASCLSSG